MESNNRRTFLRKAAFSIAALGALGSQVPAFGASFVAGEDALGGSALAYAPTRIVTVSKYVTYSHSATIPEQEGAQQYLAKLDESAGSYLNLGA